MNAHLVVDAALGVTMFVALMSGWRRGALTAVLAAVGILAGLVVGLSTSIPVQQWSSSHLVRVFTVLALVVVFVGLGNVVGTMIGIRLRDRARLRSTQVLDSVCGALFQVTAVAVAIWFVSIPLATVVPGPVGEGLRSSRILAALDAAAPASAHALPARFAALLDDSGLPPLVTPFSPASSVAAPDAGAIDADVVKQTRPSVVHVMADAGSCDRRLMGSGFVAAQDYVITNAHVVAGTDAVNLDTVLGVQRATVVFYDPGIDIAVLWSPGLGLDPLPFADATLGTGNDAVVMGFPQSGPFEAAAARIRGVTTIAGPNIYASGRVEREAYTVRGTIRQGNSGGPLLTPDGSVAGVVFGASIDSSDTGYALTTRQVLASVGDFASLTSSVDTQSCVAR
ncbi:Serine protease [Corynebacterium capitovis DSM 44611]|uniref:MarP family serine protease n=1 Tax=Corynebacterium capitovis TaxID=131081 RepID=UPI000363B312|nr:MarP family serine protease [Corynebacterium capitovis]WKD56720.1 Serine protease [Corynebacterium capitovis DSM 44611]